MVQLINVLLRINGTQDIFNFDLATLDKNYHTRILKKTADKRLFRVQHLELVTHVVLSFSFTNSNSAVFLRIKRHERMEVTPLPSRKPANQRKPVVEIDPGPN